ncbi:MAG: DUF2190 domain-containing protein [Microbacterium sp.]|uniref:capsid cement protein n=1 Tax=Microbacterium sp. TaxID=51671 RepID=UPI000DB48B34|nr:capsid cement protein [Microbacterium sp.]PZU38257.1 MAG: DUF2190 domain-containing protein [Microbacterium sp.]
MATPIHFTPATNITAKAAEALTKGTFVVVSAGMDGRNPVVKPAGADVIALGVAAHDCPADAYVTIYRIGIYELAASGAIAAGDAVSTAAAGKAAKTATGPVVGIALTKAANGVVTVALK